MSQMKSRRELGLLATGGAIAAALVVNTKSAVAQTQRQGNMLAARDALQSALRSLEAAVADKGGHKVKAIELVQAAIVQVNEGIRFSNEH